MRGFAASKTPALATRGKGRPSGARWGPHLEARNEPWHPAPLSLTPRGQRGPRPSSLRAAGPEAGRKKARPTDASSAPLFPRPGLSTAVGRPGPRPPTHSAATNGVEDWGPRRPHTKGGEPQQGASRTGGDRCGRDPRAAGPTRGCSDSCAPARVGDTPAKGSTSTRERRRGRQWTVRAVTMEDLPDTV